MENYLLNIWICPATPPKKKSPIWTTRRWTVSIAFCACKNTLVGSWKPRTKLSRSRIWATVSLMIRRCKSLLSYYKLTFDNLSSLLLFARLMRKLKITASDIDILIDLNGTDPTTSPAATLEFIASANASKTHSLKLADVRFMLYHQASDIDN